MPTSLRPQRAQLIITHLMETKKSYSLDTIAADLKLSKMAVHRSMDILISAGVITVDRTRSPWFYSYKKGSKPNIWPAFKFNDQPQTELGVKDVCDHLLSKSKNYILPQISFEEKIIYAALFGMGLEDSDHRAQYDEWLEATATKLYRYYLAYRVIRTIQNMQGRERDLARWGIENKLPGQEKDDQMSMSLVFQQMFKELLDELS